MVQFKGISEKATIQGEAVDINIPDVILGPDEELRNTCKAKGAVPHQWLKSMSLREHHQGSLCFIIFDAHIQELLRPFKGKK